MAYNRTKFLHHLSQKTNSEIREMFHTNVKAFSKSKNNRKRATVIAEEHTQVVGDSVDYAKYLELADSRSSVTIAAVVNQPYQVQVAAKLIQLYKSATRRKKEFDLSLKDVHQLLQAPTCYYTGVKLTRTDGPFKRTVDRIDNSKGYVSDNVVACSNLANQLKNDLFEHPESPMYTTPEFVKALVEKL